MKTQFKSQRSQLLLSRASVLLNNSLELSFINQTLIFKRYCIVGYLSQTELEAFYLSLFFACQSIFASLVYNSKDFFLLNKLIDRFNKEMFFFKKKLIRPPLVAQKAFYNYIPFIFVCLSVFLYSNFTPYFHVILISINRLIFPHSKSSVVQCTSNQ